MRHSFCELPQKLEHVIPGVIGSHRIALSGYSMGGGGVGGIKRLINCLGKQHLR